jgi:hypothetical protein
MYASDIEPIKPHGDVGNDTIPLTLPGDPALLLYSGRTSDLWSTKQLECGARTVIGILPPTLRSIVLIDLF